MMQTMQYAGTFPVSISDKLIGKKLKYIANIRFSNVDKKTEDGEQEVSLCNYVDVYYNDFITTKIDFMKASASPEEITKFTLRKGDVLLTKDSETADDIGIPAVVAEKIDQLICAYHLAIVRPNREIDSQFLFRYLSSTMTAAYFETRANGITRFAIGLDTVGSCPIFFPILAKQKTIAAYLDKETARIDELIAKKERQIELLQEKRQAIITHAVTKGLDPKAEMVDSGVDWIGEIPEGWEILKVKHIVKYLESGVSVNATDSPADEDSFGVLKTSCVYSGSFDEHENKTVWTEEIDRLKCSIKKGAVIISRMNTPQLVGASGYVEKENKKIFLPDRLWQTVFYNKYSDIGKYFWYLLQTNLVRQYFGMVATGTSDSMKNLAQEDCMNLIISIPPTVGIHQITTFLDIRLMEIDDLSERIRHSINLLREYRSSLITAAVSGQIDISKMEVAQ